MKMTKMKKWLALLTAGISMFSMTACDALFGGASGSGEVSESSVEDDYEPIILKNVTKAKNVILLIGDGMGPNQMAVGELYKGSPLVMQGFPYQTKVETRSDSDNITDSAAAATALATGVRTTNGVIGRNSDLEDLTTIVDIAHELGKSTGVIATEELYGATPMGFSAHSDSRSKSLELIQSAAESSNVNFFASASMGGLYVDTLKTAGYEQIKNLDDVSESTSEKIFGVYPIVSFAESMSSEGAVAFDRVVYEALEYLSKDEDGFFLMAEGSKIDKGGHANHLQTVIDELLAFDLGVRAVLEWAKDRDDTVVIVTADHETGGLKLMDGITKDNMFEQDDLYVGSSVYKYFEWDTSGHTATDVYCLINGADIDFSAYSFQTEERIQNTDIFQIMKGLLEDTI